MPVADDSERLAPRLVRTGGGFNPPAAMRQRIAMRDAAQQHDNLRQYQFGDAARIRKRRIEHRYAARLGGVEVHLVGADAKTSDACQPPRVLEDRRGQLRSRTDAQKVS